ncbi:MAG: hypothetical protein AAGD10_15535 [Myxococcota bacterium]
MSYHARGPESDSPGLRDHFVERSARHWLLLGVSEGLEGLSRRLQLEIEAEELEPGPPLPDAWVQDWRGEASARLCMHMSPEAEDDLVHAVLAVSGPHVEPSREIVVEASNVLLNGLSLVLSRALGLQVRCGLPRRLAEGEDHWELMRTSWAAWLGNERFAFQVSVAVAQDELENIRRRLRESADLFAEVGLPA